MSDKIQCLKIKLRPNSLDKVRNWAKFLNSNQKEVLESLVNEAVQIEAFFLSKDTDADYLIYFFKVQNADLMKKTSDSSDLSVDIYTRKFKAEVIESREELELLAGFGQVGKFDSKI